MTLTRMNYEPKRGQDPIQIGLIWSGPVRPASPLLWTNGRPRRPVTEILQKRHERHLQVLTSSLSVTGDRRRGRVSCPWSELCLTYLLNVRSCIFLLPPPAEERREEVLNVAFQLFIQVICSPLPSSATLKHHF